VADTTPEPGIAKFLEAEKSFDRLRTDPKFLVILKKFRQYEEYWDSKAFGTPFRETLSDAEKLAGLSKLWSEIKYNFGYPERLIELDWDGLYLQSIPRVLGANSTRVYYRELVLLCARISDGHTNVFPPEQLNISAKPPLRTGLIEGHVLVLEVMSPLLEAQGIRAGMEIVSVDGEDVLQYANREVAPYQSASTRQDRELRTFWYGFLRGPAEQPVRLILLDPSGKVVEKNVLRQGYKDIKHRPPLEWRMLPRDNVAYVALHDFGTDDLVRQWIEAFPKISESSGLILDLRLNGGGSSDIGYEVIRYLVDKPFQTSREMMRSYNPTDRARGTLLAWTEAPASEIQPRDGSRYSKPVAMHTSAATFSAAEDFLVAWKNSGRGSIIGEPLAQAAPASRSCSGCRAEGTQGYARSATLSRMGASGWAGGSIPTSWFDLLSPTSRSAGTEFWNGRWNIC
jgi:hypothetical protein